jgi:hypothetical protein
VRFCNGLFGVFVLICTLALAPASSWATELMLSVPPENVHMENRYEDLESRVMAMQPSVLRERCVSLLSESQRWISTIREMNERERTAREEFERAILLSLVRGTLQGIEQSLDQHPPPSWDGRE